MTENDSQNDYPEAEVPEGNIESGSGRNPLPIVLGVGLLALILIGVGVFMLLGNRGQATTEAPATSGESTAAQSESTTAEEVVQESTETEASTASEPTADLSLLNVAGQAKGDVTTVSSNGSVAVSGGVQPLDELYLWNGNSWDFAPSTISTDGQGLVPVSASAGQQAVIVTRAKPAQRTVGGEIVPNRPLSDAFLSGVINEVNVGGLRLGSGGSVTGESAAPPVGSFPLYMHVTNGGLIVDQSSLSALLSDPGLRTAHAQQLADNAVAGGYIGLNLDYQGVLDAQRNDFTAFVQELDNALSAQNLSLNVTLGTPTGSGMSWDTAGQDWAAIGNLADSVYIQMPLDPTAYGDGGQADQILNFGSRQIDRSKISMLVSASAVDKLGSALIEIPIEDALANISDLDVTQEVDAGESVEVTLASDATPLEWDGSSLTYSYSYTEDGQTRTIWLNSDSALAYRLRLVDRYGIRGGAVRGLGTVINPDGYAAALDSYKTGGELPQPAAAAIVWAVLNANGDVIASSSGESFSYTWDGAEADGVYTIEAGFAQGDAVLDLASTDVIVGTGGSGDEAVQRDGDDADALVSESEEEVADASDDASEEASDAGTEEAAAEEETETVATTAGTGQSNGVVNTASNIRNGPGVIYAIVTGAEQGTPVEVIGRSADSLWLNIVVDNEEGVPIEAWIYGQLVNAGGVDIASLPIGAAAGSPVAAAPAAPAESGGDSGSTEAPAPAAAAPAPPVAVAPVSNSGFELGGQTSSLASPALMQYSGMTWVKFQHKWSCGDTAESVRGRIESGQANGFKVLLAIPGQIYPSSIDFNCYVAFLGEVAALGPDGIEIWNEMNIDFEWPAGQIDPASYVNNMLAPAYNTIKSANPNVLVIGGAPAPTGFFGGGCGATGCDDDAYLRGMAAVGGGNYMDCMGVHYNAGATSPTVSNGHPADDGSGHYSWYMQPMINTYASSLGKPLCFTELGFVSGQDYGGVPPRFSWAGNTTIAQHSQWLAEAVSIAANDGRVRLAIVWNVDFTTYGDDPQAGYAIVRRDGSCPACESLRQVMGN